MQASIGEIVRDGEDRLDVTELELAQLDIWIVCTTCFKNFIFVPFFWGGVVFHLFIYLKNIYSSLCFPDSTHWNKSFMNLSFLSIK